MSLKGIDSVVSGDVVVVATRCIVDPGTAGRVVGTMDTGKGITGAIGATCELVDGQKRPAVTNPIIPTVTINIQPAARILYLEDLAGSIIT